MRITKARPVRDFARGARCGGRWT